MDQNSIESIIKNALYDHQSALDKDALWISIEKKKRRSLFMILSSIAIGLIFLSFVSYWIINDQSNLISKSQSTISSNTNTGDIINPNQIDEQYTGVDKNIEEPNKPTPTLSQQNLTVKSKTKNKEGTTQEEASLAKQLRNSSISKTTYNQINKRNENNLVIQPVVINTDSNQFNDDVNSLEINFDKTKTKESLITKNNLIDDLSSLASDLPNKLPFTSQLIKNTSHVECYEHGKKKNSVFVELYGLLDLVSKNMNAEQQNVSYLEERQNTQTQLEGYRSGLRLKYQFNNGLYVKAGLEAGMIRERFDREITTETTKILPDQLLEKIIRNDSTIYIYGDAPVLFIESKKWKIWNTYRSIGVPLMLGYQLNGNKFTYGLELGAIYNLHYDFEGYLLDTNNEPVEASKYFKEKINSSITGGFYLGYKLNKKYTLVFQSSFKKNTSGINSIENLVNQSNIRFGAGLGLQMKIR